MNDIELQSMAPETPFPPEMQGRWIAEEDPSTDVVIDGANLVWGGETMVYLSRRIASGGDGEVMVEVALSDSSEGDEITFVTTPDDLMSAFSDHFAANFVRARG